MRLMITVILYFILLTLVKLSWTQDLGQYLVGYWPINNDLHDQIACQDLAQAQAYLSSDKYGNANGSVRASDLKTRFNLPVGYFLPVPFTITLWFNPRSFSNWNRILDFKDGTGFNIFLISSYNTANGQSAMQVTFPNGVSFSARNIYLSLNTWSHLSLVQTNNVTTVYVNGTQSTLTVLNQTVPSLNLTYGFFGGVGNGYYSDGDYDEIKLFNIALNQSQIAQDFARNQSYSTNTCNSSAISYASIISSLSFYWPISNNSYDLISCNNLQSATQVYASDRFGNQNEAFSVSDLSTHLNMIPGFSLSPSFTITLWFYANSIVSWNRIFDFGFASNQDFYLVYTGNTLAQPSFVQNWPGVSTQARSLSITNNTWNHFAVSVSGLDSYFYINGSLNAYGKLNQSLYTDNLTYGFFGRAIPNGFYADGRFDEIKIFNRSLSQFEIIKDKDMQGSYSINNPCLTSDTFDYSNVVSSLLYYWPISNNSYDLISCNNLQSATSVYASDRFGNQNEAFSVSDLSTHLNMMPGFSLSPSFTITLWFYANSIVSWNRIFDFGFASNQDFYLVYTGNTLAQPSFVQNWPGVSTQARSLSITNNTWNHFAVSVTGLDSYFYINGSLNAYGRLNQTLYTDNLTYGFFGRAIPNGFYADGRFDEIKIFNRSLSQFEIIKDKDMQGSYSINNPCITNDDFSYSELISSLQYYWPIENNSDELISCRNLLTPSASFATGRFGNVNGALSVTSLSNHANIPPGFSLSPSFTITLWFYANSIVSWNRIFDFGFASNQDFYLVYTGNTLAQPSFVQNWPGVSTQARSLSITNNTWNHFAVSVTGLDSYFYINGSLNAYGKLNQSLYTDNLTYGFFGRAIPNGFYADGRFDEIKIFNRSLSQFEIIKDKDMQGSYSINNPCSYPPFSFSNLTSSLLFYWPINNDASELVSCRNLATPSTPFVADRFGNTNSALRLNNNFQNQFNIPPGFSLPSQFSITLWCIPYNFTSWDRIFDIGFSGSNDIYMASTSNSLGQALFQAAWPTGGNTQARNLILTPNTWNHLAIVIDQTKLYFYINGTLNVYAVLNQTVSMSNIPFGYFGRAIGYQFVLNGDLDEIKIFGRALSQYEIIKDKDMNSAYTINTTCQSENLNVSVVHPALTHYWPVDASKQELVVSKNLTSPGFLLVEDKCGNAMSAFRVTNGSNYVQVSQSIALSNKFTITLWYKPIQMIAYGRIFFMSDGSTKLYLMQSTSTLGFTSFVADQGGTRSAQASYISNNTWNHIAISVNGTTVYFYLNGTMNSMLTMAQVVSTSMTTNFFGSSDTVNSFGQGDFDEIKIFNVPLTQHQVIQDMKGYSDCSPYSSEMMVNMINQFSDPSSPLEVNRSNVNTFSANFSFTTYYKYSLSHQWYIYSVDSTTYQPINLITTSFNPTMTTTSFTLPSNTLNYGLYKLMLNSTATLIKNSKSYTITGSNFTYVRITPTGIAVNAIANGVTSVTLGSLQGYTLNPVAYSNDIDGLLSTGSLNFKFYCQQVNSSMIGINYLLNGNYVDLATGLENNSCIANQSMYYFNSSGNILTIKPGGFGASWGKLNQFIVTTQVYNRTFYQILIFSINPEIAAYPQAKIDCLVPGFCVPYGNVYLFSVSNQMVFEGSYSDGNEFIDSIRFTWTVYKNLGNNTSFSWSTLSSAELAYLQVSSSTELVVSTGLFQGTSVTQWMIQFEMVTYSNTLTILNGTNFTSSMIILANQQPSGGYCWVDLSTGYALNTWFTIYCDNWTDSDGIVVKYEFFATFLNNVSTVNLGFNQTSMFYTQLPSGNAADSNNLYLFVNIFDNVGSITTYYITAPVRVIVQMATLQASTTEVLSMSSSSALVQSIQDPDLSVASSAIIAYSASLNQVVSSNSSSTLVDQAQQVNAIFVSAISNYDLQDLSSMKAASSSLSVISANPVLLSSSTASKISDLCSTMTQNLVNSSTQYSLTYIYQAASYILDASANVVQSINQQSASSDLLKQVATAQINMIETITSITVSQLSMNSSTNVQKNNINLTIAKTMMNSVATNVQTNNCLMNYSNPCSIVGLPSGNCSDKTVIQQVYSRSTSLVLNSNSNTNTGGSSSISISFYDQDMASYNVNDSSEGFNVWISMSQSVTPNAVDLNNLTTSSSNQLQTYLATLSSLSQAVVVKLVPSDYSISYLLCVKYDKTPVVSSTNQEYDSCLIFCPRNLVTESGTQLYKLFLNTSINGQSFQSLGYGFRELTSSEHAYYCASSAAQIITQPPILDDSYNFSQVLSTPVSRVAYSLSCYYLDETSMTYSIKGVYVLSDSNTTSIHCWSSHLTEFAGGLVIMPDSIDFNKAWANASFTQNLTIYLTVIIVSCLYLIMLIVCRYFDWLDEKKRCIYLLKDNNSWDNYFYELIVFTGGRQDAGTESNVHFVLSGSDLDTEVRNLEPYKRPKDRILQRGSVDSFIMSTTGPLGNLLYLRIWHDNSGKRDRASWFLKFVIVHDLQTREKSYFICNEWLACDKSDGRLERILPLATDKQKTDLKYLMEKQTKQKMSDGHLWFSILARPTMSSFTRTDRLTCAFVLLCLTMLMNILYYGMASNDSSGNALVLGPFSLSSTQVAIGVMTNLIIFPPSFILLQIFRKSRRRTTRSVILRKQINKHAKNQKPVENNNQEVDKDKKKQSKPLTLPWWFKIIGYLMAFCIVVVCLFFIIVRGITFGDDLCRKWLTSFIISVLTSIFLTQPIQVLLLSIFFILLFRKSDDQSDLEPDPLDDGNSLNKFYSFKSPKKTNQKQHLRALTETTPLLKELREKREREKQVWSKFREMLFYAIFLTFTFNVAYSKTSPLSFNYQTQLQNLLLPNITLVRRVDQMWSWLNDEFITATMSSKWYNGQATNTTSYLNDHTSYLIGTVLLRQQRVKKSSCLNTISGLSTCTPDYSMYNYDSQDYGVGWSSTLSSSSAIKDAFTYTNARSIKSQPYSGEYTNYMGGGYVFKLDLKSYNSSKIQSYLNQLERNSWIDRQSRALFVEFTVYNVNLDLFAYCVILFEFLPTGLVVAYFTFDPMSLYTDEAVMTLAFDIIYMFIIVFIMLYQIKLIIKLRKNYLKHFWSYLDWMMIAFSWTAFGLYLNRLYEKYSLTKQISNNKNEIINFQTICYWNQLMLFFLGLCCFLASVRLIKLMSFSRNIKILLVTFRKVLKEMISFSIIYCILLLAFVNLMFLTSYDKNKQFESFASSLVTGFLILIGKFNVNSFVQDTGVLGQIIYASFAIVMIIILLNMFITFLTSQFSEIRKEFNKTEDSLMAQFFQETFWPRAKEKYQAILNKLKRNNSQKDGTSGRAANYIVPSDDFETKTANLLKHVDKSYMKH